ncbi:MAG: PPC domain-containing protein [Kofleriaceae bacterium]
MARVAFVVLLGIAAGCGDQSLATDAASAACSDGIDNDEDGQIDFPDDLGCTGTDDTSEDSSPSPACLDGRDNDSDGRTDYPSDPGCLVPQSDSEDDDCPDGPACPQCADGEDNDNNGVTDYPDDPGCVAAGDTIEFTDNSVACGAGLTVNMLPATGIVNGALTSASVSNRSSPCGGGGGVQGIAYVFHTSVPTVMVASTTDSLTVFDSVLDLRGAGCSDAASEIACHDDISAVNKTSKITQAIDPGTYYLIVQGKTTSDTGTFVLDVDFFPGAGTPCVGEDECGPGLQCRIPSGQGAPVCIGPVCDDGIDDDGDGKADYPLDPGCATPDDADESDICNVTPTDPACPACSNTLDDDGDQLTDYPDDPSCAAASTTAESCLQSEPVIVATGPLTSGTTTGATNDYTPVPGSVNGHLCSTTSGHTAPDRVVQLDLPATQSLQLRLNPVGFDSSHTLLSATCSGAPIDCSDNATMNPINGLAAGRYYVVIDGYASGAGTFTLNVLGTIANGESCETPFFAPDGLQCNAGYVCKGAAGSRTCAPAECSDMADNNTDGRTDFPEDPGCSSVSDDDEDTVCPGASCPACADGVDNDGDSQTDYPMDTSCAAASSTTEECRETEPLVAISAPTTTGTLVGATDDHDPSCATSNLPDRIYSLNITQPLQSLVIDTEGSAVDTVLSLMDSTCTEPALACDDEGGIGAGDSLITRNNVLPGRVKIAVDAKATPLDTFALNVRGTLYPGASCEGPLVAAGVVVCPPMFGCNGAPGSRTCTAAQCLDGIDNNGNGRVDFPNDPGCTSASDNAEDTVCPGASCPACGDGIDNDGDGRTDYPADAACVSAAHTTESCFDTDAIQPVTLPLHAGTLVGATDDRFPMCATTTGADVVWSLDVPALQSLTIDTEGSVVDTILQLMDGDCSSSAIACDDDGAVGFGDSLITRTFVPAGRYTIGVDTKSIVPNTYNLAVRGVIAPGGTCEHPLFAAGVLTCSVGFACDGPAGSRTCSVSECTDGIDNNSDGRTDFPFDPGCASPSDDDETTVCPGTACPVCSDGVDNDLDGQTDFPNDATCTSAASDTEACRTSEPVRPITGLLTTGNTTSLVHDFFPACGSSANTAPDEVLEIDVPAMDSLTLNLIGFDTAHSLLSSACENPPLACSDPSVLTRTNMTAGRYYVVVDGWGSGSGEWSLATTGIVAPGGSCEGALFAAGAFTCSVGHSCAGTAGSRVCTSGMPACSDGTDNDGDTKMDYPADPGCLSADDTTETDACPGAGCPACGNGADDDTDGATDYPADPRCVSASFFLESFCPPEMNIAGMISTPATAGTLVGAADDFEQSCQTNTGNDVTYGLALPVPVSELVIHTVGSAAPNTVLSLWTADCMTELACDDDGAPTTADNKSLITQTNVAAGNYAIQVDSFGTTNNSPFLLNVRGTVAPGTACTSPLFSTGVLVCPSGTTCSSGTCQ